jgi:CelD/BcsL family acetyltransferase involved in cellulose biosynthesis
MSTLPPAAEAAAALHHAADGWRAGAGPFVAEAGGALEGFLAHCEQFWTPDSSPFHAPVWLRAWYATFGASGGRLPLPVTVRRRDGGAVVALLPLALRRQAGLRVVEFADGGVVDYIAPILAPHWQGALPVQLAAQALWQAVRAALRGNDVIHLHKLVLNAPEEAGGAPDPLALALPTAPCEMFGNQFSVDGDWEAWRRSLDKRTRKEIERCWRVFQRSPEARFEHATDPTHALALFDTLEQQQSRRMRALQADYQLDAPECRAFYRQVIEGGVASGLVVMTALQDGEHVVSALFGLANGQRYLGLRQSLGGEAWKACSPARLLDEQTARHLHAQGRRHFDFGIGDYHHKQALQMRAIPLVDACVALGWRGVPVVWAWRLRRALKRQSWLVAALNGLRAWRVPQRAARSAVPSAPSGQ